MNDWKTIPCLGPGCERYAVAKGYCRRCYSRMARRGTTELLPTRTSAEMGDLTPWGANLVVLRLSAQIPVAELCRRVGVSVRTYYCALRPDSSVGVVALSWFAAYFKVPLHSLFLPPEQFDALD